MPPARVWLLLLACLALSGCLDQGPCRLGLATILPLRLSTDGHLLVPATINGQPVSLMVDTGSARTILNPRKARGVVFDQAQAIVHGIGGSRFAGIGTATVKLGTLRGQMAIVGTPFPAADGILGIDILGAYDVDFDWPGRQLRLFKSTGACGGGAVLLSGPIYSDTLVSAPDHRPTLALVSNGVTLIGILDTGAPGLMLSQSAADRIGISRDSLSSDRRIATSGIGPRTASAHLHRLGAIRFGPVIVTNVPAVISDQELPGGTDFLLGTDILRRIHLWLANSTGRLILQYPPQPSPDPTPSRP